MRGSPLDFDEERLLKHDVKILKGKLNIVRDYRDPYANDPDPRSKVYKDYMKEWPDGSK